MVEIRLDDGAMITPYKIELIVEIAPIKINAEQVEPSTKSDDNQTDFDFEEWLNNWHQVQDKME